MNKPAMAAKFPANRSWQDIEKAERQRNDALSLLKSLSVSEPLLSQLVHESMTGFIFILDDKGTVEFISDSCTKTLGYLPSQIRHINDFVDENEIYRFLNILQSSTSLKRNVGIPYHKPFQGNLNNQFYLKSVCAHAFSISPNVAIFHFQQGQR